MCHWWVIFLPHINVVRLPSAVGGARGGDRECSGAEGLWQDGRGHPPHWLLQERGLRTWVCSCRMTCLWDVFFTLQSGHSSGCSKLGCWWLTSAYSPSGEQFNPPISMDLQVHFYPRSTHSCPCPTPAHAPHRPAGEWSSLVCGDRLQPHPAWQTVGALSPRSKFNHFHSPDVQMSCIHRPKKAQADVWSANTRVQPRKQYNTTVVFSSVAP